MTLRQEKLWDYFILSARFLIAWTLLRYGWGKLTDEQFGLTADQLTTPVKDLGLFKLSWYLFDHEPFKSFIGISQIIAGLLILYNRTLLLGTLLSIPIITNILIIDITYLKMPGFYSRLTYYLILDALILFHYREKMLVAFRSITTGVTTKFKFPIWAYFILPIIAIGLEILPFAPIIIARLICYPTEFMNFILGLVKKICG